LKNDFGLTQALFYSHPQQAIPGTERNMVVTDLFAIVWPYNHLNI